MPDKAPRTMSSPRCRSAPSKRYGTVSRYAKYGPRPRAVKSTSISAVPTALTAQVAGGVKVTTPPS
jgi:hypothetical protein